MIPPPGTPTASQERPAPAASWDLRNLKRRVVHARNFPHNTCGASRHLHMIADVLASKRRRANIEEIWEPEHLASTMYAVLEDLWKLRTKQRKRRP
jgi:hypothetical protein